MYDVNPKSGNTNQKRQNKVNLSLKPKQGITNQNGEKQNKVTIKNNMRYYQAK